MNSGKGRSMESIIHVLIGVVCLLIIMTGCFFYMIMPRIHSKKNMQPFFHKLYAHRGLFDNETDAPENSLKAFQKAVDAGFGMEMDVQITKDGIPVIFHDFTLERMCGAKGKISDYLYDELKQFTLGKSEETIPTLKEVLDMVQGREPLIIEIKVEHMDLTVCKKANDVLLEYPGRYCIESFHPLAVRWYRRNRKDIVRGQLSGALTQENEGSFLMYFLAEHLMMNFLGRPDFIAYDRKKEKNFSRRICRGLFANTAVAWTIKSQEELEQAGKQFDLFIFDSFLPDLEKIKMQK